MASCDGIDFAAKIDFTVSIRVRVRWWVRPMLWLAGRLASFAVTHGIKVGG